LDQIERKFRNNYYHNLDDMLIDLNTLIHNTIKDRCQNALSKIYLTNFLIFAKKTIASKKKEFLEKWVIFYNARLNNNAFRRFTVGGSDPNVWYKKFDESSKR